MKHSKVVEISEWSVTTAAGEEMSFRVEILADVKAPQRVYWARLYRLEFLRLGIPPHAGSAQHQMEVADYRVWVCDDNFNSESDCSTSAAFARRAMVAQLSKQLGVAITSNKVRATKKRSARKR